jgi:acyl carrier protein
VTIEEVLATICEELAELETDERITLSGNLAEKTTLEALSLDSLDMLQFVMKLEERLGVPLELKDLPYAWTLGRLAEHILGLKEQRAKRGA